MNELVVVLCGTILAGHETTTHLISNALKVILERPQLWQALCEDASLIPAAIEEVLRLSTTPDLDPYANRKATCTTGDADKC